MSVNENDGFPEALGGVVTPIRELPVQRIVHRIGAAERDGIWSCNGPVWRAFYAWDPKAGWLYSTPGNRRWRESSATRADVTADTITWGRVPAVSSLFVFRELVRLADPTYLFDPNGQPVEVPDKMVELNR